MDLENASIEEVKENLKKCYNEVRVYGLKESNKEKFEQRKFSEINFRFWYSMVQDYGNLFIAYEAFRTAKGVTKKDFVIDNTPELAKQTKELSKILQDMHKDDDKIQDENLRKEWSEGYKEYMATHSVEEENSDRYALDIRKIDITKYANDFVYLVDWFTKLSLEDKLIMIVKDRKSSTMSSYLDKTDVLPEDIDYAIKIINQLPFFPDEKKEQISLELKSFGIEMSDSYDSLMKKSNTQLFMGILATWAAYGVIYFLIDTFLWSWMTWFVIFYYPYASFQNYKQLSAIKNRVRHGDSFKILLASLSFGM